MSQQATRHSVYCGDEYLGTINFIPQTIGALSREEMIKMHKIWVDKYAPCPINYGGLLDVWQSVTFKLETEAYRPTSQFTFYEDAITDAIRRKLDITRGDAQGIIEAHSEIIEESYENDLPAQEVFNKIVRHP